MKMHQQKSTVEEIRARFDHDVERFSNLETGQAATIDAPLAMELIVQAAAASTPQAQRVLDVGCGAGNYTLKLLQLMPHLDVTLNDLSQPMLDRAQERVAAAGAKNITVLQGDVRELKLGEAQFDIIMAAAVLHHLRGEEEWHAAFAKFYRALRPGGSMWISDLVTHSTEASHALMWQALMANISRNSKMRNIASSVLTTSKKKIRRARSCFRLMLSALPGFD
jgi:tRNA (cmo5U34)-methyltransferase